MISKKFCKSTNNQRINTLVSERSFQTGHSLWVSNTQVDLDVLKQEVVLTEEEENRLNIIGYERRKREFLGVRYVVQSHFGKEERIVYSPNGKPMLENSGYRISISHSGDLEAVLVHENVEVGIDLQHYTDKIMKIATRFMSDAEKQHAGDSVWSTLVYWCAKEALFKYYAKGDVDFREHLFVEPFQTGDEGELKGHIFKQDGERDIRLWYEKLEDYMLVYTLNG